jgi:hypothetical protein
MKCEICEKGPRDGVAIYRQNAVGVMPAIWRCRAHREASVDPEVQHIVDVIEADTR